MRYNGKEVTISVYAPRLAYRESDEYSCQFSICGGQLDYSGKSIGFDSMQALILSLTKIGTFLKTSVDVDRSLIEWDGGPMEFPVFRNV
jgi:hypothetical protein